MKKITIYDNKFWIDKGYTEEESIKKVNQCKKENSCWNKEYWIVKKGYSEEEAIKKVSEKQSLNSKKQDKTKIKNVYSEKTWVDKGYSLEESTKKVNELKDKSNIYKNLSKEKIDSIIFNRKKTFYSKSDFEIQEINKSKGRTKQELIDKYGEDYVMALLEKRGSGRRNSFFKRYSKISKDFFDELSNNVKERLLYAKDEKWVRFTKNKGYFVDLIVENTNKIIEFNGDFYHANPKFYENDAIIKISENKILYAQEIWNQDEYKFDNLKRMGYDVLIIWENDVLTDKQNEINKCVNFIKNKK